MCFLNCPSNVGNSPKTYKNNKFSGEKTYSDKHYLHFHNIIPV